MRQLAFSTSHQAPSGCRAFRPQRRTLQVCCLHKALRQPSSGPITAPADVVYECLTLLRRPDLESLAPFFPAGTRSDPRGPQRAELRVGGEVVQEVGPLAGCSGFMDTAARRVLPGHLLRRCRVLSAVQLGAGRSSLRVAVTGCSGEETVLVWHLRREDTPTEDPQQPPPPPPTTTTTTTTTTTAATQPAGPGRPASQPTLTTPT
ncbi:hypothetical protein Agub_g15949, partial [Astrephomene gubernaculifera]